MNQKLFIYIGIVFLLAGIILRSIGLLDPLGLSLIFVGVGLKTTYITLKIVQKEYRPGWELGLLACGLAFFFYSKNTEWEHYYFLMAAGIALKVAFVVLFIRKVRKSLSTDTL